MGIRFLFLGIILLAFYHYSSGQEFNHRFFNISVEKGLSSGTVNCIVQDKQGFIWLGTNAGLNRYDGYNFVHFKHDPKDSSSLSNNSVKCLLVDSHGNLWIGTSHGLNKYDPTSKSFKVWLHQNNLKNTISDNSIFSIFEDKTGTIWIATYLGLNKFNKESNSFTLYQHIPQAKIAWDNNSIFSIAQNTKDILWVGTAKGLSAFDINKNKFTRYKLHSRSIDTILPKDHVRSMVVDKGKIYIATTGDGLKVFDLQSKNVVSVNSSGSINKISSDHLLSLYKDSFNNLWIGTQDAGLDKMNLNTNTITNFSKDPSNFFSINDNSIVFIYEDKSRLLWLGTFSGGVNKLDLAAKQIYTYKQDKGSAQLVTENYVGAIHEDKKGNVWIGRKMGLDKLDRKSGKRIYYTFTYTISESISDNTPQCIYEDANGNIWLGLPGGGLKRFNIKDETFDDYYYDKNNPKGLPSNSIQVIYNDKKGKMWLGTRNGLCQFDSKSSICIIYNPAAIQNKKFEVVGIEEDHSGKLWIASLDYGIFTLDENKNSLELFHTSEGLSISGMFKDKSGNFWIFPNRGGLMKFDPLSKSFYTIEIPAVLTKFTIRRILQDESDRLWISTATDGIVKYDPVTGSIEHFTISDGLQSNELTKAADIGKKGEMYFGGKAGFNSFYPDSLKSNPYSPEVVITSFKVFDKERSIHENSIVLPYSDNFFSFEFAGLSYALPERNQYAYMLDGFDQDWVQAGTRRYASYTNLDPGNYVLKVIASNHDGVWNKTGTSMVITINPPWYRTTIAYLGYVLIFIGILYAVRYITISHERINQRLKQKQQESDNLKELDKLKSRFFTNISHEFRTPLTLILSPLEKIMGGSVQEEQKKEYYTLMHRNAKRLLEFINQLLDLSKLEGKGMQLELFTGDLVNYVNTTVHSFIPLMEIKNQKLLYHQNINELWCDFDKDKLGKIIANLLSNANKYTPINGTIIVVLDVQYINSNAPQVILKVSDDGIGIPASKIEKIFDRFYQVDNSYTKEVQGAGVGLALTKELVEFLGGQIVVQSQEGKGTTFNVILPVVLGRDHTTLTENLFVDFKNEVHKPVDYNSLNNGFNSTIPADHNLPLILIVEDNDDVRGYIRSIFEGQFRIVEAVNGEDGLQRAIEIMPDLIISDLMMPKMDGRELCKSVKTDERTAHIPVILLTARTAIESKLESLEVGGDDYITKPFHEDELKLRVKNQIEFRKRIRDKIGKQVLINPSEESITSVDKKFLDKVIKSIEFNISDPDFGVDTLEMEIGMSRAHLYRKLKALTNHAPSDFIREFRIKKAAYLLTENFGNVSEVAYKVGFNNLSYFTKCFKEAYGVTPSQYSKK